MTCDIIAFLLLLAGCGATPEQLATGVGWFGVGSIAVIQRSPLDAALFGVSAARTARSSGSDQGKSYCRPVEPPPEPPPYCTRSLGVADCWRDPASLPDHPRDLGDGPHPLTPEQEANRTRRWPPL